MTQAFLDSPDFELYEDLSPPFGLYLFYLYNFMSGICITWSPFVCILTHQLVLLNILIALFNQAYSEVTGISNILNVILMRKRGWRISSILHKWNRSIHPSSRWTPILSTLQLDPSPLSRTFWPMHVKMDIYSAQRDFHGNSVFPYIKHDSSLWVKVWAILYREGNWDNVEFKRGGLDGIGWWGC